MSLRREESRSRYEFQSSNRNHGASCSTASLLDLAVHVSNPGAGNHYQKQEEPCGRGNARVMSIEAIEAKTIFGKTAVG
jgi:hypothetical protein